MDCSSHTCSLSSNSSMKVIMATASVYPGACKPLVGEGIKSRNSSSLSASWALMSLTQMLPVLSALFIVLSFFLPFVACVTKRQDQPDKQRFWISAQIQNVRMRIWYSVPFCLRVRIVYRYVGSTGSFTVKHGDKLQEEITGSFWAPKGHTAFTTQHAATDIYGSTVLGRSIG